MSIVKNSTHVAHSGITHMRLEPYLTDRWAIKSIYSSIQRQQWVINWHVYKQSVWACVFAVLFASAAVW